MSRVETLPDRLENQLLTIIELSKVLSNNAAYKDCADPPQIDSGGESAICSAITFIGEIAHNDFCDLMNASEGS
ncbi:MULTISPECIES: hypothetical protein [Pseudomonas]|uniref:hypothetical protein n=1 Tax=Pseudomonas TaxID=286 RepID=UPI00191B90CB|nr:hypothetical protein [Pseudomonas paracarnis]